MKKILVTCFDPFDGALVNPSQLVLEKLTTEIEGVTIIKQVVPTVFKKSIDVLYKALDEHQPDAVLCVGQAGGRTHMTVERVAINVDDARIKDNEGNQPVDTPIFAEGAPAYFASLPIKAMVDDCNKSGVPASISNTAGTFVCNHLMYAACHYAATKRPELKAGFVHIPFAPEQTTDKATMPSMAIDTMLAGVESFLKTIINVKEDIKVTGGAEH